MELVQANSDGALVDFEMGASLTKGSFAKFLDSQRELFHSQIEQLQKIVVVQGKLTGINPLSQEMAAGALSIKIGKRPRDLLNPKAIKYMQSVFSIKDTIGKKETREISALCGATITQVREFFAGQRSRVRKLVRLSREKAIRSDACKVFGNECPPNSNHDISVSDNIPVNFVENKIVEKCTEVLVIADNSNAIPEEKQTPLNSLNPKTVEESNSSLLQDDTIPGINLDDQKFLENIFSLMRKEETFAGQVKLMEWVLQINNSAILYWFLTKGGIDILATWLSQAVLEEQTTVILVIFKVLCHLPLLKALPVQMSTILQTVNKLRFYRTSDISNKARLLLSRWSKLLVRSQAVKKPSSTNPSDAQKERFRKQRISEILSDGSWQSRIDIPDGILALGLEASESITQLEPKSVLRLLPASCDNSNKKHERSVSASKTKERRKVLLVEQPNCTAVGRSVPSARIVPSNVSRPISADDIQKAKMRAVFMQNKYGKIDSTTSEKTLQNNNDPKISSTSQGSEMLLASKSSILREDEDKKYVLPTPKDSEPMVETSIDSEESKPGGTSKEVKMLKNDQILWQKPPEMRIKSSWSVGTGENSKEVEVQTQRNRREKETFYPNAHDIPPNPKDPWDVEMDFDDSLTPEIPTEQPPDVDATDGPECVDGTEFPICSPSEKTDKPQILPAAATIPTVSNGTLEPDLELLAVLLKNPDLVFALTSGQGNSMTDAQTVAVLDMLKKSGSGLNEISNGLAVHSSAIPPTEPTSLPSPTPTSEFVRTGWRREPEILSNNQQMPVHPMDSRGASNFSPAAIPPSLVSPPAPKTVLQSTMSLNPSTQQHPDINLLYGKPAHVNHQISGGIPQLQHTLNPDPVLLTKHYNYTTPTPISSQQQEPHNFQNSLSLSNLPSIPPLLPTPSRPQPPLLSETQKFPPIVSGMPPIAAAVQADPKSDSWNSRQNGLVDVPGSSYRIPTSHNQYNVLPGQNQYNVLPSRPGQMSHAYAPVLNREEFQGEEEFENWSPNMTKEMMSDFRSGTGFGQDNRMDQSWQGSPTQRNHNKSGRRWRNWDRDHRRR